MKYLISKKHYEQSEYPLDSEGYPDWSKEPQPHKDAYQEGGHRWELRSCDEKEFDRRFGSFEGLWRSKGTGHDTYLHGIKRLHPETLSWVIDIDDLESFCELSNYPILIIPYNADIPMYLLPQIQIQN